MQTKEKLLQDIKAFCQATNVAPSTFGRMAVGNSRLVKKLEQGGDVYTAVLDRVRAYMEAESRRRSKEKRRPLLLDLVV